MRQPVTADLDKAVSARRVYITMNQLPANDTKSVKVTASSRSINVKGIDRSIAQACSGGPSPCLMNVQAIPGGMPVSVDVVLSLESGRRHRSDDL